MANRHRLFALLEARIKEEANRALQDMGDARCKDYPAYLYQCGYIKGMQEVAQFMDEIEQHRE